MHELTPAQEKSTSNIMDNFRQRFEWAEHQTSGVYVD